MCGGNDRWRWDNRDGCGSFICSHCGAGDGIDLVQKINGVDFLGAKALIEGQIGSASYDPPKAKRNDYDAKAKMAALWARARALDGQDVGSRYFRARGIENMPPGAAVRLVNTLRYREDGEPDSEWPALLAKFAAPDGASAILHRTYIAEPGVKAPVAKPRKMFNGAIPSGGAVRLGPIAECLGVAEGIETALCASQRFSMSVWACTSAAAMIKWTPPAGTRRVIIFADLDRSFTGQMSGYSLAYRLKSAWADKAKTERYGVEVRFTRFQDDGAVDEDWCDAA
jgi:putative DNA primase/helicase